MIIKERDTWKMRYGEAMAKAWMVRTLSEAKKMIWQYVFKDYPKVRTHLAFYLVFKKLNEHVRECLELWTTLNKKSIIGIDWSKL